MTKKVKTFLVGTGIHRCLTFGELPCKMHMQMIYAEGVKTNPPYYLRIHKYILCSKEELPTFRNEHMEQVKQYKNKVLLYETMAIGMTTLQIFNQFIHQGVSHHQKLKYEKNKSKY